MSTSNDDNDSDPDGNAHVLYVDHQGHPAPLAECYHATASRRLSSSIDRYPSSTVTEVDSAFCPQCLSFHDAATAATLGYCPKATCQQCPLCTAIASVTVAVDSGQVFYECSGGGGGTSCQWTSKECNLMVTVTKQEQDDEDGSFDKIELARALEDLGTRLVQRKREKQEASDKYFNSLTVFLEQRSKVERQAQRISKVSAAAATADGPEGWSVEALEATLEEKKTSTMFVESDGAGVGAGAAGRQVEKISLENNDDEIVDSSLSQVSLLSLQLQSLNYSTPPRSKQDLLPLPIPLRVRTSRRCRAELAEGRPGILLKPKLNPLEGDTSLRSGHGQWWKKDSSAVHVIPRVRVVKHAALVENRKQAFLLKVTNPTLGTIRLRFSPSTYQGEQLTDTSAADQQKTTLILSDLLVDTFTDEHSHVEINCNAFASLEPTQEVELLSAEDSFIEFGGKSKEIPYEVLKWDPTQVEAAAAAASNGNAVMQLVAQSASTAWFELVVPVIPTTTPSSNANDATTTASAVVSPAVALALQIEVGNGSWQSSLVQPKQQEGDAKDWVTFDLLITWNST